MTCARLKFKFRKLVFPHRDTGSHQRRPKDKRATVGNWRSRGQWLALLSGRCTQAEENHEARAESSQIHVGPRGLPDNWSFSRAQ